MVGWGPFYCLQQAPHIESECGGCSVLHEVLLPPTVVVTTTEP